MKQVQTFSLSWNICSEPLKRFITIHSEKNHDDKINFGSMKFLSLERTYIFDMVWVPNCHQLNEQTNQWVNEKNAKTHKGTAMYYQGRAFQFPCLAVCLGSLETDLKAVRFLCRVFGEAPVKEAALHTVGVESQHRSQQPTHWALGSREAKMASQSCPKGGKVAQHFGPWHQQVMGC